MAGGGSERGTRTFEQRRLRLKLRFALLLGATVLTVGTLGYRLLQGWGWLECLYMTVITISTVGFKEVGELSAATRGFTILLIFGGIGSVALIGSSLIEWMIEQHASHRGRRRKMTRRIDALEGHIVVCGYGRMGRYVSNALVASGAPFVVVEQDAEICAALAEKDLLFVQGDASDEAVLETAGVKRAAALVAALSADAENLYLTLTAHGMNSDVRIIVRAEEQASHAKFVRAGAAKVISPYAIGADHIVQLLLRPSVVDFIDLVAHHEDLELDIEQIRVDEDSPLAGKSIAASRVRQALGRMILAIKNADGTMRFDPPPDTVLNPGDCLVTVGRGKGTGAGPDGDPDA